MEYLTPFMRQGPDFPHIISTGTSIPNQALDLMLRIRPELPPSSLRSRLAVKTYLKMILMLLVNHYAPYTGTVGTFERQQRALDRLAPLFNYIRDNCEDRIQIREAARLCNMGESHFMGFFKHVTGLSFMKYLNHYRVERSQALLANTDEPMASISQKVGFCDQSYFGMVFHKLVGVTPAAYRRSVQGEDTARRLQMDHTAPIGSEKIALAGMPRQENIPIGRRRVTSYSKSFLSRSGT
jgi:AraC-like DNA-binding protein